MKRTLFASLALFLLLCNRTAIGQPIDDALLKTLDGYSDWVTSIAYSPDGRFLASGSSDKTVKIWDMERCACVGTLTGHSGDVRSVAYSPDGSFLASGSYKEIKIWKVASGLCIHTLTEHSDWVNSLSYSLDGRFLTSGSWDKTVKVWNLESGACMWNLTEHSMAVYSIAYSPDGNFLASGSYDETIKIWNTENGKCVLTLTGHSNKVSSVSYSPDGKFLASGSWDHTVKIWNVTSGECVRTLIGNPSIVYSVAYSPDGKFLSIASDKEIKIWNVVSGECVRTLIGHSNIVKCVVYSPYGKYIASGSPDKTVRIWQNMEFDHVLPISNYINKELNNWSSTEHAKLEAWKQKGEFEKTADYNQRIITWPQKVREFETALQAYKDKLTKEAPQKFMTVYSNSLGWDKYKINGYDTENESFKITIPKLGDIVLAVPFEKAQAFKTGGSLTFANQDFALTEKGWVLKSLDVVHSTLGTFKYDATKAKGYEPPKQLALNLTLPNIKLDTKIELSESPTSAPKEAVYDVDNNLPKARTKNPNAIAIIIGIETYKDIPGVTYARRDAETFKAYAQNILGVPEDKNHAYLITNEDATKGTFEKVFTEKGWLAKRVLPESDVYVFYAGHGAPDVSSKKAYLIPYDGDANYALQTGFSLDRLYEELNKLNARSVTVFLDACFSGGTREKEMILANARPLFVKIDNAVLTSEKLSVFAASSGEQISSGYPDANHGLFSYCLFKGMKGEADANKDGTITLDELGQYLKTTVSQKAGQLDREQTPELMTRTPNRTFVKY